MTNNMALVFALFLLPLCTGACVSTQKAQVMSRSVTAVSQGGPQEVWVVMGETGTQVGPEGAVINRDAYSVYHCVPQGCKRVSELQGSEAFKR